MLLAFILIGHHDLIDLCRTLLCFTFPIQADLVNSQTILSHPVLEFLALTAAPVGHCDS